MRLKAVFVCWIREKETHWKKEKGYQLKGVDTRLITPPVHELSIARVSVSA